MKSRRNFLQLGFGGAALAALGQGQTLAAASTALFRNHLAKDLAMTVTDEHLRDCPVVELRQYTLQPGTRERFIALFEHEFIESQEELGMTVIGQFRDLDDPNRFVWLRGFVDMASRGKTLPAFYAAPAPAWKAHREEANSMIVDSDNVLLLHAAKPQAQFALSQFSRAAVGATESAHGLLVATIYYLEAPADKDFIDFFGRDMLPALAASGIKPAAYFASETSANNFPRLPVRENEPVFVWFALYKDQGEYQQRAAALNGAPHWRESVAPALRHRLKMPPQTLRLTPTSRSLLHV
jgi:hypothetical protein